MKYPRLKEVDGKSKNMKTKEKEIRLGYIQISGYKNGDALFPDWYSEEADNLEEIKNADPEEIVLQKGSFSLKIDYPLSKPFVAVLDANNGLTRRQVVSFIVKSYKTIYKEEESGLSQKPGNIPGMFNRERTSGKYGIWGHDIGDLTLHTLHVNGNNLTIGVDS